jgi:excisionase family DNA binding protein
MQLHLDRQDPVELHQCATGLALPYRWTGDAMSDGLTFTQTAQRMGVGVHDVRRWVRTEQCPVIREGRKVRIPAAWVDDPEGWAER